MSWAALEISPSQLDAMVPVWLMDRGNLGTDHMVLDPYLLDAKQRIESKAMLSFCKHINALDELATSPATGLSDFMDLVAASTMLGAHLDRLVILAALESHLMQDTFGGEVQDRAGWAARRFNDEWDAFELALGDNTAFKNALEAASAVAGEVSPVLWGI